MKQLTIALLATALSMSAFAQAPVASPQFDKQKARLVSRFYQLTDGSVARCKKASPGATAEFSRDLARFKKTNASLMKLIKDSPYLERAQQQFAREQTVDPARDTPEKLASECTYLAELLRDMTDTEEGRKSVEDVVRVLSAP